MSNNGTRLPIIESLILSSPEPLPIQKIIGVVNDITFGEVDEIVEELNRKYIDNDLSFRIRKIAGGYQFYIIEDYTQYVEELLTRRRNVRLTKAALETLAIISYRQPVTKMEIELIRGVASDSVLHTLLERKLITLAGRAETVGKPLLYKTTDEFLKFFNLDSLDDLPRMEEIEELLAVGDSEIQQSLPLGAPQTETAPITLTLEPDSIENSAGESIDVDETDSQSVTTEMAPDLETVEEKVGPIEER